MPAKESPNPSDMTPAYRLIFGAIKHRDLLIVKPFHLHVLKTSKALYTCITLRSKGKYVLVEIIVCIWPVVEQHQNNSCNLFL